MKPGVFRLGWLVVWTCACGGKAAGTGSADMDGSDELPAKVASHDAAAALADATGVTAEANGTPTIDATLADAQVAVRPDGATSQDASAPASDAYPGSQVDSGPMDAAEAGPASMLCNGSPVDLASDSANCGACGHDCLGGACSLGACQPVAFASAQDPWFIFVNAVGVYWGDWEPDGGTIMEEALDGGSPVALAAANLYPLGIAGDSSRIYWPSYGVHGAGSDTLWAASLDGGAPVALAVNQTVVAEGVAVDATSVYWGNGDAVMKMPLDGGPPVALATGQTPSFIVVDANSVYWTNWGTTSSDGALMKTGLDGGPPQTLASGLSYPLGLVVDSSYVYWANRGVDAGGGNIMKVPLDGGAASTMASGQSAPFTVALDESSLYWTDYGNGLAAGAWRVALDGAAPQQLPSGPSVPFAIAVDSRAIYWTSPTYSQSAIMRLAK